MNIFTVETCPVRSAQALCDKHVVKMPVETAQMLSTAVVRHGGTSTYRPTHSRHPCTVWAGDSRQNFRWLVVHGMALCHEYTARYGKVHKSQAVIQACNDQAQLLPLSPGFVDQPICMPDEYRRDSVVESYREFYRGAKSHFATWKRNRPEWF